MKKIIIIIFLSTFFNILSSCGVDESYKNITVNDIYDFSLSKNIPDISQSYYIDNDGDFYYFNDKTLSIHVINTSGVEITINISNVYKNINSIYAGNIQVSENHIYFTTFDYDTEILKNIFYIIEYDINTSKYKILFEYNSLEFQNGKMQKLDNYLIFTLSDNDYTNEVISSSSNSFHYMGERIKIYDLNTNSIVDIGIDHPVTFDKINDEIIMISAFDKESGYYFIEYNLKNKTYGEQYEFKNSGIKDFVITEKADYIIYTTILNKNIYLAKLNDSEHYSVMLKDVEVMNNSLTILNDKIYYIGAEIPLLNENIFAFSEFTFCQLDFSLQELLKKQINVIGSREAIPGLGYALNETFLSYEEFSLKVLAADSDWDICAMSSKYIHSQNIKNKGIYEPLSSIEGINNIFSKYLPSLQDVMKTKSGDIWMIPYSISGEWLLASPDISLNFDDYYSLSENLNDLYKNSSFNSAILYNDYIEPSLRYYASLYTNFNDDELRYFSEFIKEKLLTGNFIASSDSYNSLMAKIPNEDRYNLSTYNNFIYSTRTDYSQHLSYYFDINSPNIIPIPNAFDGKYSISCDYVYVNPFSKNKSITFEYLSDLIKYLPENDKTFLFNDSKLYDNNNGYNFIKNISDKIEISFSVPDELYSLHFKKYLTDELSIDEMILNIKNNLNIYMNE